MFSESAIKLGKIQVEFDCLYGTKEMRKRLTQADRSKELLRICNREDVSFEGFQYLERKLIFNLINREITEQLNLL
ncbi:MAG: hypothetical protein CMI74_03990 [Candidatus Pelagibacter sp.]|nr:hypothetical protein [Candidatus Pelagibacter sp.]|tara:strand:+ start:15440 stop:15667 length:228 start_codon:yes stop_codon:yes gene_type:complete